MVELQTVSLRRCLRMWSDVRLPLRGAVAEDKSNGEKGIRAEPEEIDELRVGTSVRRVDEAVRAGEVSGHLDFVGFPRLIIRNGLGVRSGSS